MADLHFPRKSVALCATCHEGDSKLVRKSVKCYDELGNWFLSFCPTVAE